MAWSIFQQGGGDNVAVAWAQQLLTKLGVPVTPGNTEFIYQWEKSEGGGGAYNPLNTGSVYNHPELTTSGSQYGGGANDFASWDAGLTGSAINIQTPGPDNYPAIVTALKNNDPAAARQALWNSGWAASHYGYGSNWSDAPLPGNSTNVVPPSFFNASSNTPGSTATGHGVDCGPFKIFSLGADNKMYDSCVAANKEAGYDASGNPIPGGKPPSTSSSGNSIWSIGGVTLLSKTQARAVVGAGLLVLGGTLATVGILALMRGTIVAGQNIARNIPLAGRVVR